MATIVHVGQISKVERQACSGLQKISGSRLLRSLLRQPKHRRGKSIPTDDLPAPMQERQTDELQ